ncbi:MAG: hypothetical protein ACOYXW_16790 [Actinomycetota bacterium]
MAGDDVDLRRAAELLRHLLTERPAYAQRWRAHARQAGSLNQAAVAQVLAMHLWETGEADERDDTVPRRLKDAVSRALAGKHLSARTLAWFIDAFQMTPEDATTLWALRTGSLPSATLAVVHGSAGPAVDPGPVRHRTLSLHEVHTLGQDGLPVRHHTTQVVQALEPLSRYPFRFDTDVAAVHVLRGGRALGLRKDRVPGLYAVDIELTRPLRPGQTTALEYVTSFAYRSPPPPEFRRAAYRRVDNVEIVVRFHPDRLPRRLEWCEWRRHDEPEAYAAEPVELEPDCTAHRYLARLENAVVGYRWMFTDPA